MSVRKINLALPIPNLSFIENLIYLIRFHINGLGCHNAFKKKKKGCHNAIDALIFWFFVLYPKIVSSFFF